MTKLFLNKVVDVDVLGENGELVSTKKYPVLEDKDGEYIEIFYEDVGKRKYYLKDNMESLPLPSKPDWG